jgi:hypothetical protein
MSELELFEQLSRQPRFKAWLENKLTTEHTVLCQMNDVEQLRRAQGRAQLLKSMLDLLDKGAAR